MGFLDELKKKLGLDEEQPLMVPPPPEPPEPSRRKSPGELRAEMRKLGVTNEHEVMSELYPPPEHEAPEMRDARLAEENMPDGQVMVPPPDRDPANRFKSPEQLMTELRIARGRGEQEDPQAATDALPFQKTMREQRDAGRLAGAARGGEQEDPQAATDALPFQKTMREQRDVGRLAGAARGLSNARPSTAAPPGKAGPDTGHADLMAAIDKAARPPEEAAEQPAPAQGEKPTAAASASAATEGGGSGPLGSVTKMLMAAGPDPRTDRLRAALEESARLKRLAGHVRGMGIGADLVEGVHVHGNQGKDIEERADDLVKAAMLPTEFEQKNARFDTEQQRAAQDFRLRESGEGRAQQGELRAEAGEKRAGAQEQRQQQGFDTTQASTDPKSNTSANARASIESLYPAAWHRIPADVRNNYSAKDVDRIFGEVKPGDFAPKGKGGGVEDRMNVRLAAQAKLNDPGMVHAMNDILATLDSGSAPGTGYFMNAGGWQNFLRTQAGKEFRQAMFTVMNPYIKEVHGANVTDNELERAMTQFGYGNFDDPESLAAGMRRVAAGMEAKQKQKLRQLPPESAKMLEDRGAAEHVDAKRGRALKGDITDEQHLKDAVDVPESLKPFIGVLGAAKEWLRGGRRSSAAPRDRQFDSD